MRLALRSRAVIALLLAAMVGYLGITFGLSAGYDLVRVSLGRQATCSDGWASTLNSCSSFNTRLAILELLVFAAAALGALIQCGRWILQPLNDVTATVAHFGPTNLRSRINPDGPRDEARRLAEAIDVMLDRVADGYESQRRFAANASHELRTPLATQRALIEVSMASPLTGEQQELLAQQLLSTNERNEHLIGGLLTLAETDQGLVSAQPVRLDLVVTDTVQRFADRTADLQISCRVAPTTISGEQTLLDRLVGNLLDNAVKYNVPAGRIDVDLAATGVLRISNTGQPVPADSVSRLFEPFQRLSRTRLAHTSGVGLGLTIVRSIVTAHHGTITAAANPSGGLTLWIAFPASDQAAQRSDTNAEPNPNRVPI